MKVGDCFYKYDKPTKYHVVNIFEDNSEIIVVYKYYGKYKQWWHYSVEDMLTIEDQIKHGYYKRRKQ